MDIDTAFLNAPLKEDIYMLAPPGMVIPEGKVLKLHKCRYGLKQSPRYFNQHLATTVVNMGIKATISDPCLFQTEVDGKKVLVMTYVDDILIACSDHNIIQ